MKYRDIIKYIAPVFRRWNGFHYPVYRDDSGFITVQCIDDIESSLPVRITSSTGHAIIIHTKAELKKRLQLQPGMDSPHYYQKLGRLRLPRI